jgi:putative ABC transport system ATP-binding protein
MITTQADGSKPQVLVDNVDYFFGKDECRNQVLFNNNLRVNAGELVVMTGPSGSGKTTLLTLIGGLRALQSGRIDVLGQDISNIRGDDAVAMRRSIGIIFQMHNLFDSLSAYENVRMAMQLSGCPANKMRERGTEILKRLGLGHRLDYKPRALSGGQRQRVAVARAIVNQPKLILADEPTAALDKESSRMVVGLLKELTAQEGCTVMMVTHDNRILELADRIVSMIDGSIKSDVLLTDAVRLCEFLRNVDLFKHLTPSELTYIAGTMRRARFAAGQVIIEQGDVGAGFFIIGDGAVNIVRNGEHVATLSAGDFFGERALITNELRNATVVSHSDVQTYIMGKIDFQRALKASPSFKEQIYSSYFQRN